MVVLIRINCWSLLFLRFFRSQIFLPGLHCRVKRIFYLSLSAFGNFIRLLFELRLLLFFSEGCGIHILHMYTLQLSYMKYFPGLYVGLHKQHIETAKQTIFHSFLLCLRVLMQNSKIHGSYNFRQTKFKEFSRTLQGQKNSFQGVSFI